MKINVEKFCKWLHEQIDISNDWAEKHAKQKNYHDAYEESKSIEVYDFILDCIENNPDENDWIEQE